MSGWGDRLWAFGAGIFMNLLAPENLRLVAIYGFATSVSVIVFGALIGSWIDNTSRLTAAKTFLAVQNLIVTLCCGILAVFFWFDNRDTWPAALVTAMPIVAIILAVIANLATVGYQIAVEKDWIVVISDNDNDQVSISSMFYEQLLSAQIPKTQKKTVKSSVFLGSALLGSARVKAAHRTLMKLTP